MREVSTVEHDWNRHSRLSSFGNSSEGDQQELFVLYKLLCNLIQRDRQECLSYPTILSSVYGSILRHHGQS